MWGSGPRLARGGCPSGSELRPDAIWPLPPGSRTGYTTMRPRSRHQFSTEPGRVTPPSASLARAMTRSFILRSFIALAAIAAGDAALAQSAPVSALPRRTRRPRSGRGAPGGGPCGAPAGRDRPAHQLLQVDRLRARRPLRRGLFGGGAVPAECGSITQRIRQMEANYERLRAQIEEVGGSDARRRQLMAAIEQTCNAPGSLRGPAQLLRVPLRAPESAPPGGPDRFGRGHAGRGWGARRPASRLRQDLRRLFVSLE